MKRIRIQINGIVQGVGFRPFIHKLVQEYGLNGWVRNSSDGVIIELEGNEETLTSFLQDIGEKKPKLALIEEINWEFAENLAGYTKFEIIKSVGKEEKFTLISPDVCICEDCLNELFDKNNRRYRFPFINCTNCGPRFTIIKDIPYDRDKTTMSKFPMCSRCKDEYCDIENRRYHAQPDCCYDCGPELTFLDSKTGNLDGDPIENSIKYLNDGKIIAVKGLGGFHLACDAYNVDSVKMLRLRKHRDEKPFAIMCRDIETVKKHCTINNDEIEILNSYKRPIVLLKKRDNIFNEISMDNKYLGIMLPYTPVHYLLMSGNVDTILMTSANISDLPVIYKNEEALEGLKGIADGFLMNNRDIHVRCDDSLIRVFEGREYPLRRSRGYVPFPIKIQQLSNSILACGAEQKASFAVTKDNYVFMSQHIGDLKNIETLNHYEYQIEHFKRLFNIDISKIACDLHPDYMSTDYAEKLSLKTGIPLTRVQHHHAHMASCMADNNISDDVIGIIWDGTGYGTDGTIWGGEFLTGGYKNFKRSGTIRPMMLPGGDLAVKEIYRLSYALLYDTFGEIPDKFLRSKKDDIFIKLMENGLNCPKASSIGRLFDGVSALLNFKDIASYEGQGAIILENKAALCSKKYIYEIYDSGGMLVFDWRPMIRNIVSDIYSGEKKSIISTKFMNTLIDAAAEICQSLRVTTKINNVVLSGGVFQNMYLLENILKELRSKEFNVYYHSRVSTNDEGIALGQVMITENGGGL